MRTDCCIFPSYINALDRRSYVPDTVPDILVSHFVFHVHRVPAQRKVYNSSTYLFDRTARVDDSVSFAVFPVYNRSFPTHNRWFQSFLPDRCDKILHSDYSVPTASYLPSCRTFSDLSSAYLRASQDTGSDVLSASQDVPVPNHWLQPQVVSSPHRKSPVVHTTDPDVSTVVLSV